MKKIILILGLLLSIASYSQENIICGVVKDIETNDPIPYANIGILNADIGTVSDKDGKFTLKIPHETNLNQQLTFTYIGYANQEFPLSSLVSKNNSIKLKKSTTELKEVVISLKRPKQKKIGKSGRGSGLYNRNFYTFYEKEVNDRLSKEMGMKLKLRKDCRIEDLNFYITGNQYKSVKFRVYFYSIKNNEPDELLINNDIIFEIKDEFKGWFKVDLKSYDINIEKAQEDIAVTIQWLESEKVDEKSKYFSISAGLSPLDTFYYRDKAMGKWKINNGNMSFYLNTMCY